PERGPEPTFSLPGGSDGFRGGASAAAPSPSAGASHGERLLLGVRRRCALPHGDGTSPHASLRATLRHADPASLLHRRARRPRGVREKEIRLGSVRGVRPRLHTGGYV